MAAILEYAQWYVSQGLSVIPVKADGSKSPKLAGWRKYSTQLPTQEELETWFNTTTPVGIGIPAGPASGNLVILDFEFSGSSAYVDWIQRLPDEARKLAESLPTVTTPSGGKHVYVRLENPQNGAKLARYANGKTKIEIRGEGHQVLAPGCPAECHSSGKLYEWSSEIEEFPQITSAQWIELVEWCCQCNEYQAPEQPRDREAKPRGTPAGVDSPGSDFNTRATWADTGLFDAGWKWARQITPEKGFITRPGKDTGISASIGMVSSKDRGYPYLYVWSTNSEFTSETPFSKFAVYAFLKHGNDYSAAAAQLARDGFGERATVPPSKQKVDLSGFRLRTADGTEHFPFKVETAEEQAEPATEAKPEPPRIFKWMSELNAQSEELEWIWEGYLPRGAVVLFSSLWKTGKSTILSHLLRALGGNCDDFLGQKIKASRVLYVTEEHEDLWAKRRDTLMITDHVGMICRPFNMRPTMPEWKAFLATLAHEVQAHHFDLVVFDTLSKMWPVREENDASQVDEALMPLWSLSKEEVCILLVHHSRKSGGQQFVGARGSGALPSFADLLIEFDRYTENPKETKRTLTAMGRYAATPVKRLAELRNGQYVGLGDPDDVEVRVENREPEWKPVLFKVITDSGEEWQTYKQIFDKFGEVNKGSTCRKADLLATVKHWFEGGEIERRGDGNKGSPYEYRAVQFGDEEA